MKIEQNDSNLFIVIHIFLSGLLVGLQSYPQSEDNIILIVLDYYIYTVFLYDIIAKFLSTHPAYIDFFCGDDSKWNIFYLITIIFTFPQLHLVFVHSVAYPVFQIFRLLRFFKLLQRVPDLWPIFIEFLEGIYSLIFVLICLSLTYYFYAIIGYWCFHHIDSFHFSNISMSILTLFRVMILDSWSDILYTNAYGCEHYRYTIYITQEYLKTPYNDFLWCDESDGSPVLSLLYFFSFVLVSSWITLSLFIGVINLSTNIYFNEFSQKSLNNPSPPSDHLQELSPNRPTQEILSNSSIPSKRRIKYAISSNSILQNIPQLSHSTNPVKEKVDEKITNSKYPIKYNRRIPRKIAVNFHKLTEDDNDDDHCNLLQQKGILKQKILQTNYRKEEDEVKSPFISDAENDSSNTWKNHHSNSNTISNNSYNTTPPNHSTTTTNITFIDHHHHHHEPSSALSPTTTTTTMILKQQSEPIIPFKYSKSNQRIKLQPKSSYITNNTSLPLLYIKTLQNQYFERSAEMKIHLRKALGKKLTYSEILKLRSSTSTSSSIYVQRYKLLSMYCQDMIKLKSFKNITLFMILLSSLLMGLELDERLQHPSTMVLLVNFDIIVIIWFIFEIIIKFISTGTAPWNYFYYFRNILLLVTVIVSFIPKLSSSSSSSSPWAPFKLFRLLRLEEVITNIPNMHIIIKTIGITFTSKVSFGHLLIGMLLPIYCMAYIAMLLFSKGDPLRFKYFHLSFLSLFRMATLDNWNEVVYTNMFGCDIFPGIYATFPELCEEPVAYGWFAAFFFISFTLISSHILVTVFTGAVTTNMMIAHLKINQQQDELQKWVTLSQKNNITLYQIKHLKKLFQVIGRSKSKLNSRSVITKDEINIAFEYLADEISTAKLLCLRSKFQEVDNFNVYQFVELFTDETN